MLIVLVFFLFLRLFLGLPLGSMRIGLVDGVVFCLVVVVGNLELHLIRYISDRVERLSDDGDGLRREIGEEGDSHEEEDGGKSRRPHYVFQILYHEESMLSAGIEDESTHDRSEELGESDRRPYHDNHQAEEPFPEVHLVCIHELQASHDDVARQEECRETEVHGYEPVGDDGTQGAAVVLELLLVVGPFACFQILQYTLVGISRVEE